MSSLPDFLRPLEFLVLPFPREAVAAAIARREESTPHLLRAIEWADAHPGEANDARPPYMLHLFALFLLAQFREPRALPLITRLFRNPEYEALTGDIATDGLGNILASVSGGGTAEIERLIEDSSADEWVRGAAVSALGVLLHQGVKARGEISAYLGMLFAGRIAIAREPNHVWDCIIELCTDFGMIEHLDQIRRLYRDEIADPTVDRLADVEREIALPPGTSTRVRWDRLGFIDDAIAEMESWACFDPESDAQENLDDLDDPDEMEDALLEDELDDEFGVAPSAPIVRETPKVGRNDPCPCGSGKKYKKCCGGL